MGIDSSTLGQRRTRLRFRGWAETRTQRAVRRFSIWPKWRRCAQPALDRLRVAATQVVVASVRLLMKVAELMQTLARRHAQRAQKC